MLAALNNQLPRREPQPRIACLRAFVSHWRTSGSLSTFYIQDHSGWHVGGIWLMFALLNVAQLPGFLEVLQ